MTEEEQMERLRALLVNAKKEVHNIEIGAANGATIGRALAELGAMMVDAAEGRYVESRKGTTTRRVRKALGYTYP